MRRGIILKRIISTGKNIVKSTNPERRFSKNPKPNPTNTPENLLLFGNIAKYLRYSSMKTIDSKNITNPTSKFRKKYIKTPTAISSIIAPKTLRHPRKKDARLPFPIFENISGIKSSNFGLGPK